MDADALHAVAMRAAGGDEGAFQELRRECEPMVRQYLHQKIVLHYPSTPPALVSGLADIVFDVLRRRLARYPDLAAEERAHLWVARTARWVVVRYYEFSSGRAS